MTGPARCDVRVLARRKLELVGLFCGRDVAVLLFGTNFYLEDPTRLGAGFSFGDDRE